MAAAAASSSSSLRLLVSALMTLLLLLSSSVCCFCSSGSAVTHLPGFDGPLPFYLETGYVGVDENDDTQLFYYFIESEGDPKEDPLMLWLTGGPGCSVLSGLAFEIGPMKFRHVKYDGSLPTLYYFPDSWTKVASIIFLDFVVGSGFSFSRKIEEYNVLDTSSSKQVYTFLRKWFLDHPQFLGNRFYVGGDSYGGKVVPVIAKEIIEGIEAGTKPLLNFEGYMIGNPSTGELVDMNSRVPCAHNMGILSYQLYKMATKNCEGEDHMNPKTALCASAMNVVNQLLDEIHLPHILEPNCPLASPKPPTVADSRRSLEVKHTKVIIPPAAPALYCRTYVHYLSYYWANNEAVRKALHVQKGTIDEWVRCGNGTKFNYIDDISSNLKYQHSVISEGYRALVYSGDHDLVVPFIGTLSWMGSLNFSVIEDWRSWHVGGQVAGYTRTFQNNLTFATVKGAGHTAPEYKPKECLEMIRRWLSYKPL